MFQQAIYQRLGIRYTAQFLQEVLNEGVEFDSGKVWVLITLRNLRAPGYYAKLKKSIARGRLIVTHCRLVALAAHRRLINIDKTAQHFQALQFNRSHPRYFTITIPLERTTPNLSGEYILSYRMPSHNVPL